MLEGEDDLMHQNSGGTFFDRDDLSTNSILHPQLNKGVEGTSKPAGEMGSSAQIGVRRAIGGLNLGS